MKKIKAFTLMELLVAMIISSIVVGIASLAYEIVYKQYYSYKKNNNIIVNGITFDTVLKNDFMSSDRIIKSIPGITITGREGRLIYYKLSSDYIIREVNHARDTFFLPVALLQLNFQKKEQDMVDGYVDELYFESVLLNEKEKFHFFKQYGADVIMEEEKK